MMGTLMIYLAVALLLAFVGSALALIAVLSRIPPAIDDLQGAPSELAAKVSALEAELRGLRREVEALPTIWKDEADRAIKAEKRAAYHARRAEELRGEGDGDGAPELVPNGDVPAGRPQGVSPVYAPVASDEERLHEIRRRIALGV